MGVSGYGYLFEIFDVSKMKTYELLSKNYVFFFFFVKASSLICEYKKLTKTNFNSNFLYIFLFFENICCFVEPFKEVELGDLENFHMKIQKGTLFAVGYSGFG